MALIGFKVCAHAIGAEELVSDPTIGNPNLKALKADRVKHDAKDDHHDHHNSDNDNSDNDNSDDDDLPPLSDLLHEWRRERSIERRPLSLTQCIMTERLLGGSGLDGGLGMADAGAKIASLKPGDSPGGSLILGKFSFLLELLELLTKIRQRN